MEKTRIKAKTVLMDGESHWVHGRFIYMRQKEDGAMECVMQESPNMEEAVDADTICRYAGLNYDGIPVYEGDILDDRHGNVYTVTFSNGIYGCTVSGVYISLYDVLTQDRGLRIRGNIFDEK